MTTAFDEYAAPGTTELDCMGFISAPGILERQLAEMWREEASHIPDDVEEPDFHDKAQNIIDDILRSITWKLHGEVCDCDSKRCTLWSEIHDWLADGDFNLQPYMLVELVTEWKAYAGGDA